MNKLSNLIFTIVIFFLLSCQSGNNSINKRKEISQELIGQQVILPNDSVNIKFKDAEHIIRPYIFKVADIKLIAVINGDCGACVNKLTMIQQFYGNLSTKYNSISLITYIYTKNKNFFEFDLKNEYIIKFEYPLIYDIHNSFLSQNKLPGDTFYHIMLCDKNNKILIVGDFTEEPNLIDKYYEKIEETTERRYYFPNLMSIDTTPLIDL